MSGAVTMNETNWDVTAIGNAIVDVLNEVEDDLLAAEGLTKGSMTLIEAERAAGLCTKLRPVEQRSGGSAANTIAGLASLGARAAFIGKVADDELGQFFSLDLRAAGASFDTRPCTGGVATACCVVLVTPDAQRTMCTYLGACGGLGPDDVDRGLIERSQVTYLEGYLWDPPRAKEAFLLAAQRAHAAGRQVALSLSDSFCVDRHRQSFRNLARDHVDLLLANEAEILSLYQEDNVRTALAAAAKDCRIVVVTRGALGALVSWDDELVEVPAEPVSRVVDTTGAGDLFAAGFLFGFTRGQSARDCAVLGGVAAAEVIGHFGARPQVNLAELAHRRLGL